MVKRGLVCRLIKLIKMKNIRLIKVGFKKRSLMFDIIDLGNFSLMVFQFWFFGFGIAYQLIDSLEKDIAEFEKVKKEWNTNKS
ncbi:hypothetical protein LCGC14_0536800 [marine sediment metagenome]|uniref:Uncharacterized protein n=1 Tax=marine sediment metagenome TaxID=412755 RepID=A0A0F9RTZ7_9ZZZZ